MTFYLRSMCSARANIRDLKWYATSRHFSGSGAGRASGEAVASNSRPVAKSTQHAAAKAGERADIVGLRLSHENTYLSWSRNGIIATVAAVGIHTATVDNGGHASEHHAVDFPGVFMQPQSFTWPFHVTPPAAAMLGVAGTFFSFGTVQYIVQLSQLGPLLHLTPIRRAWMGAHALGATSFWALGVGGFALHQPTGPSPAPGLPAVHTARATAASAANVALAQPTEGDNSPGTNQGTYAALEIAAAATLAMLTAVALLGRGRTS